jgi:hypothetical protein
MASFAPWFDPGGCFDRHRRKRARFVFLKDFVATAGLSFLFCALLCGCRLHGKQQPLIKFTKIPPAAQGGRERVDTIAGQVTGARPGQRIVIYARSGPWWVQPWPDKPFITIQPDSKWSTETHLGYEYAALLVDSNYNPPATMDVAPVQGGGVVALNIVKGTGSLPPPPTKPLQFSGYDWKVRTIAGDRGGTNNLYDGDNAWVDESGAMHLRIKKKGDRWACAEAELNRSLGYGTYRIVVRDTSHLEPAAILSMHTFDEWGGQEHYRELDIEIGRWGNAKYRSNAQFGVQPFYVPGNVAPFDEPSGTLTHSLHWESGRATFETVRGASETGRGTLVSRHTFTAGVPSPGQEVFQFIFYVVASDKNPLQKDSEVVVEKFEYLP